MIALACHEVAEETAGILPGRTLGAAISFPNRSEGGLRFSPVYRFNGLVVNQLYRLGPLVGLSR